MVIPVFPRTVAEVAATPWNGMVAASLFSGCGGSSLGVRAAGFRVAYACEVVPAAAAAYRANADPATVVDGRDVRDVKGSDLLDAARTMTGRDELDLLEGSPPCTSFSRAGKRHKGWGEVAAHADGTRQRSDDLFFEFTRIVAEAAPRAFFAENVATLADGVSVGVFRRVAAALTAAGPGYRVAARILDAQWLGVPQVRRRLFFVGIRTDLNLEPPFPTPHGPAPTIRDALTGLPGAPDGEDPETGYRVTIEGHAIAPEWDRLAPGKSSDRYFNLIRPRWDEPCPTITASATRRGVAGVTHPEERRKFTLAELRRLCGFPDDFKLPGAHQDGWARLGNSVPPPMAYAVATELRNLLAGDNTPAPCS